MKQHLFFIFLFTFISLSAFSEIHPGDSIVSMHTSVLPVIDGDASDSAWNIASWNAINYSWNPYAEVIPAADFSGRFKVIWNKETNLLYFLVEITDDIFVKGYKYINWDGSYPLYDIVEVFLDENRPGGEHGCNNTAFAYHITSGNATTDYDAIDIYDPTDSYNWGGKIYVNNRSHLPEFKRTNVGTKYIWEFSLMVLKSTFKPNNDPALFKASLVDGKKMGLTVAYCDDDHSATNLVRDHFVASKYETQANQDISWQNSTTFGHLTLKDNSEINGLKSVENATVKVWVDAAKQLNCKLDESWSTPILQLLDISGRVILEKKINNDNQMDISSFKHGYYLVVIKEKNRVITKRFVM